MKTNLITIIYTEGPFSKKFVSRISGLDEDSTTTIKWVVEKQGTLELHRRNISTSDLSEILETSFTEFMPARFALVCIYPDIINEKIPLLFPREVYRFDRETHKCKVAGYLAMPATLSSSDNADTSEITGYMLDAAGIDALYDKVNSPLAFVTEERAYIRGLWNHAQDVNGKVTLYL